MGNENQNQGMYDKAKGTIKEGVGNMTDDERLKNEGRVDKAKGEVEESVGNAQEKIGEATRSW